MIKLMKGDCIELMKNIPDGSIDLILTDPPYGTTACKWDTVIPFESMWTEIWRVLKPNGVCALFGSEPFSSALRVSQIKYFKYDWYWKKDKATGHLNAKKQPMRNIELISVFYKKQATYVPQLIDKSKDKIRPDASRKRKNADNYGSMNKEGTRGIPIDKGYPKHLIEFRGCTGGGSHADGSKSVHPTQKPVDLLEYLIKTFTVEGETVLDFTMGSGSTGVASVNTSRKFIGIEQNSEYFKIAQERITLNTEGL